MTHQGTNPGGGRCAFCVVAGLCLMFGAVGASGQAAVPGTTQGPVVDSSSMGPAVSAAPKSAPTTDASAEASPVSGTPHGVYVPVHTEVDVRLLQSIDSAKVHNGEMLNATLVSPVKMSDGHTLPAGTKVGVTVLAAAPAGKLQSRGELTLQVTHVGTVAALTDAQTFFGTEGHKDLPDAAPAKGTEAAVASGTTLKFHVAPTT